MKVIEKNEGPKLVWAADGTRLTLGDDEIALNLAKYEQDWPQHIDVVRDRTGCLATSIGAAAAGLAYAAEIDIPAREYTEVSVPSDIPPEPVPFDMDNVTLTLWALL